MAQQYVFGRIVVRPQERVVRLDGHDVPLGSRAFDLLVALIDRRERVVSKNELLDLAWPGLVVEENNLSVQISALRKLLGPNAIVTISGRGYRFALSEPDEPAAAPAGNRISRRLAAVAVADLVDWDAELVRDPGAAIAAWQRLRRDTIEPGVLDHAGRVVELSSRGATLEFPSAVDGLRWALDLQHRLAALRSDRSLLELHLRIGIGVEDSIVDEGRLVGSSGALMAQLLQAAAADQVVVDEILHTLVEGKLPVRFRVLDDAAPGGAGARRIYLAEERPDPAAPRFAPPGWSPSGRPGVAVLPFDSGAEAGGGDYYGDGITEEIVSRLSCNRSLFVIARSSTLRYRRSMLPPSAIAAELGVAYLLSGTVQRSEQRLHLSASLVDAKADRVIWAQPFDGFEADLFDFQAEIAAAIAAAIDPALQAAEIAHAAERPTDHLGAYDCVLRGLAVLHTFDAADFALAGQLFERALALDPRYARAHAHLAWWHNLRIGEGRTPAMDHDGRLAEHHAQRAIELDPQDAWALAVAGHIQSFVRKRTAAAMDLFQQALSINPSCTMAWARSGTTLAYMGQGDEALRRVATALRLSPFDPMRFSFCTTNGTASIVAGRPAEAVGWLSRARRLNPGYRAALRLLVAALALNGELDEAREAAREFMNAEPGFRVGAFGAWYALCEPHLGRLLDAMRAAGLPD